jgi:hypothetical protein
MNCDEYREQVTVRLADGTGAPGDHGAACAECARYAERARAAWEAAGRWADEPVPPSVAETFHSSRRPRRADLTLLRPGPLAAAAVLVVSVIVLLWPRKAGIDERSLFEADGMSVERYDLPAGADAARVAEEIRREVVPEAWGGGECGLESGDGFLRVRARADIQRAVRDHLRKLQR